MSDVLHSSDTGEKLEHDVTLYKLSRLSVWYSVRLELSIITGLSKQ